MDKTETKKDEHGYLRFVWNNRLVHRTVWFTAHPGGNLLWHVHHINGNKLDNRLENLLLLSPSVHLALHKRWPMRRLPGRETILLWLNQLPARSQEKKKKKHRGLGKKLKKQILKKIRRGAPLKKNLQDHPWVIERLAITPRQYNANMSPHKRRKKLREATERSDQERRRRNLAYHRFATVIVRPKAGQERRVTIEREKK